MAQNTPNPFNPSTTISFSLAQPGRVEVAIYNTMGQKVRTLVADAHMGAGRHRVAWDGRDHRGLPVSSGIYLYQVRTRGFRAVRKMIMLK